MNWKFSVGQVIEATWGRKGTITKQVIMESGQLKRSEAAYEIKSGRRKFAVAESDIQTA